jgi:hypothetical protein
VAHSSREQLGERTRNGARRPREAQLTVGGQLDVNRHRGEHGIGTAERLFVQLVSSHRIAQRSPQLVRNAQFGCRRTSRSTDEPVTGKPPAERGRCRQCIATDVIEAAAAKAAHIQGIEELLDQAQVGWLVHDTIVR